MKKSLLKFNFIFLGLFVLVLFTSCAGSKKVSDAAGESTVKNLNQKEVTNVKTKIDRIMVYLGDESVMKWKLVSFNSQNASELYPVLPMMRFDEPWKQIYGITGCNKFTAYYERDNSIINISRVSATEAPCGNTNESLFLDTFKSVNEIKEEGNSLSLQTNGQPVMVFERY